MKTQSEFAIWPPYEAFYIQAMLFNSRAALASIDHVSANLEALSAGKAIDSDELLNNLQNIVIHGAALSRYFWPVRKGHEARAQFLKKCLGVAEDSPLKNRDLRNQIEHFDEKLD